MARLDEKTGASLRVEFRALRSSLRPHTRSGGYADDSIGRYALMQFALDPATRSLPTAESLFLRGPPYFCSSLPGDDFTHDPAEDLAALFVVVELIPARAAGAQQADITGLHTLDRPPRSSAERPAALDVAAA